MAATQLSRLEVVKPADPLITGRSYVQAGFENGRSFKVVITYPGGPLQVAQALDSLALMIHRDPILNPRS